MFRLIFLIVIFSLLNACATTVNPPNSQPYLNKPLVLLDTTFLVEKKGLDYGDQYYIELPAAYPSITPSIDAYLKNPAKWNAWHHVFGLGAFDVMRIVGILPKGTPFVIRQYATNTQISWSTIKILGGKYNGMQAEYRNLEYVRYFHIKPTKVNMTVTDYNFPNKTVRPVTINTYPIFFDVGNFIFINLSFL